MTDERSGLVVAVVGATATGKSALGLMLAERFGGEVVNADATQLYRGLDIGTAKLTVAQRRGIPHHLLDVLDVAGEASVAAYQRDARLIIDEVIGRGHLPLLVGGSGLYVRAVLDRLEIPPTDPAVRARWEAQLSQHGVEELYAVLRESDPVAAEAIQPRNGRRIVRALEVIELTGRPFSATMPERQFVGPTLMIGLRADREALDERIAARTATMWAGGLLDEVRGLLERGLRDGRTASTAIGYQQALAHLDGRLGETEAIEETVTATRRLVRRQESWFRADPRIDWLDSTDPGHVDQAAALVARAMKDNGTRD